MSFLNIIEISQRIVIEALLCLDHQTDVFPILSKSHQEGEIVLKSRTVDSISTALEDQLIKTIIIEFDRLILFLLEFYLFEQALLY